MARRVQTLRKSAEIVSGHVAVVASMLLQTGEESTRLNSYALSQSNELETDTLVTEQQRQLIHQTDKQTHTLTQTRLDKSIIQNL